MSVIARLTVTSASGTSCWVVPAFVTSAVTLASLLSNLTSDSFSSKPCALEAMFRVPSKPSATVWASESYLPVPLTKVNTPLSLACVAPASGVKVPAAMPVT